MGSHNGIDSYPPKKPPLSTSQSERLDRYMKLAAVALHPAKPTSVRRETKLSPKN
jgi:hypothetical protein